MLDTVNKANFISNKSDVFDGIRTELYKNLNNKGKNWKLVFDSIISLDELKNFYEKQKATFTNKKKSSTAGIYFFEFISSFLKFEDDLDNRSKEILAILFSNLKEVNKKLYLKLKANLNKELRLYVDRTIIKNNNWKELFLSFDDVDDLFNFYISQKALFSKKSKNLELVNEYYIPFIEAFVRLKTQRINTEKEDDIYKALILLEANILEIDINFDMSFYLKDINYEKYVKIGVSERKAFKRWNDFFSFFADINDIISYYDKVKTTFNRKVKQNDKDFFKYFIISLKNYAGQDKRIDTMIYTLVQYYRKLSEDIDLFLTSNNIDLTKLHKPLSFKIQDYREQVNNINNLSELLFFYKTHVKSFPNKAKQGNRDFFEGLIKKFEEFSYEYKGRGNIVSKLKFIEKHLQEIDKEYKLPEDLLLKYEKPKEVKKTINKSKPKNYKKNNNKDKQKKNKENLKILDPEKEYKIIINNLQTKGKRADGMLWYNVGLNKLENLFLNGYFLTDKQILGLISYFKINDIYKFYKKGFFKKQLNTDLLIKIVEKTLILKNLLSLDDTYFPIFKKFINIYLKEKKIEISSLKNSISHNKDLSKYLGL